LTGCGHDRFLWQHWREALAGMPGPTQSLPRLFGRPVRAIYCKADICGEADICCAFV